jgi:hypothetical protein
MKMAALRSSETSAPTRAIRHNIPEDGIPINEFFSFSESRRSYGLFTNPGLLESHSVPAQTHLHPNALSIKQDPML